MSFRGYDAWKTRSPDDEPYRGRNGWRDMRDREACWRCDEDFVPSEDDEERCAHCNAHVNDEPAERDPDEARDDAEDRRMHDANWRWANDWD